MNHAEFAGNAENLIRFQNPALTAPLREKNYALRETENLNLETDNTLFLLP
jgi:hypothetical protein